MNHFMTYDPSADNNIKVFNELAPSIANKQLTGTLGRSQNKFGVGVEDSVFNTQKSAVALFNNLKKLLANDPGAESKKFKILRELIKLIKTQPLAQPQPQPQPQRLPQPQPQRLQ